MPNPTQNKPKQMSKPKSTNKVGSASGLIRTTVPMAQSMVLTKPMRSMKPLSNGGILLTNTEVLVDTVSLLAAGAASITIIPLLPSRLPWLSGVAVNYAKFTWRRISLTYVPFCSTSTAGRFAFAISYDAGDTAPTTVSALLQIANGAMAPIWGKNGSPLDIKVPVSTFNAKSYNYISTTGYAALANNTDKNVYLPAQLVYGTDNGVVGNGGTILISYDCELSQPITASTNV